MKKQILYLASVALAAGLAACSSDELEGSSDYALKSGELAATIQGAASTRTTIYGYELKWAADDEIGVYGSDDKGNYQYTLTKGEQDTKAVFKYTGKESFTPTTAYYPYDKDNASTIKNGDIYFDLAGYEDNEIVYSAKTPEVKMPMVGTVANGNINFSNTTALVHITVVNMPSGYTRAVLINNDESAISGSAVVNVKDDEPVLETQEKDGTMYNQIAIINGSTESETAFSTNGGGTFDFYFIVPARKYAKGLTFSLGTTSGGATTLDADDAKTNAAKIYTKKMTAEVNHIYEKTLRYEGSGESWALQDDELNDLNEALESNPNNTLTADLSSSKGTIYIPAGTSDLTLDLTLGAGTSYPITIADADANNAATRTVNVIVNDKTESSSSLSINLLSSDVKLLNAAYAASTKAEEEKEVTAITVGTVAVSALGDGTVDHFLRIGNKVTVSSLAFTGYGNAFVEDGGTVGSTATGTDGKDNYAFYEATADPITGSDTNLPHKDKTVYDLYYPESSETPITLQKDYSDLTKSITITAGKNVTIDLNGHTLTAPTGKSSLIVAGTLTIQDTASKGTVTSTQSAKAAIEVASTGTLNIQGGTVTNTTGVAVEVSGKLNLTKGIVSSTVSNSPVAIDIKAGSVKVNIPETTGDDGEKSATLGVTADIKVAGGASFTLENGLVNGTIQAAGSATATSPASVTISGGKVAVEAVSTSALTLDATSGAVSATISGGEVTSADATIKLTGDATQINTNDHKAANACKLTVSGGTITSSGSSASVIENVTSKTCPTTIEISGGVIKNASAAEELQGTAIKQQSAGSLTIKGGSISAATAIEVSAGDLTVTGTDKVEITGTTAAVSVTGAATSTVILDNANAIYSVDTADATKFSFSGETTAVQKLEISAGLFNGNVQSENTHFISGGNFKNCDNLKTEATKVLYLVDGKKVTWDDTNKYYTVVADI